MLRQSAALLLATALLCSTAVWAQAYPSKPIRLVVPFPPGASNDTMGRAVAQQLNAALGQPVVIDNRSGAGGSIGAAIVARAPADGYTLMFTSTSYTTNAALQPLPFDPVKEIAGVAMAGRGPMMIVVPPAFQAQNVQALVAMAKAQPGRINYVSSGIGSAPHLATELFARLAGIDVVHVPYKGLGPALTDLIAGRAQILIASLPSVWPHVKTDRLRGLALTSAQRSSLVPGMPTAAESGVPGYTSELWWGLFAPARTPAAVIDRLNAEVTRLLATDEMKRLLATNGAEPASMSPAEFNAFVRADIAKWRKVVQERGIKPE